MVTSHSPNEALLGRFLFLPGKGVILLKLDTAGQWNRMAPGSPLTAGDKLLVLPTFRPTLQLNSGITLQVPSETLIELQGADASGAPGIKLDFGRLVLMSTGQAGAKLRIDFGSGRGTLVFPEAEATVGLEVRRYCPMGVDPEVQEPRIAADIYAVSGNAQWIPAEGLAQSLAGPQRLVVEPFPNEVLPPEAIKQIPKWIASDQTNPLIARAGDDLLKALSDESRPMLLELREMADSRRFEDRAAAADCLALLDQFEPLVVALNDPDEHAVWPMLVIDVRAALARGPATATKIREAFQAQRGKDVGQELYRMLWGYTKDQLQAGDAAKLVEYLDNDNLDFRVLAFTNLQEITGSTFDYRPETPAVSREGRVYRWQELLRKGLIVPRKAPAAAAPNPLPAGSTSTRAPAAANAISGTLEPQP